MGKPAKKILERFVHPQVSNASKTLLANIRFASVDKKVKTIAITSSESNEGKTIVSTNLANAIATSGKRVLIVETDMRRRSLGKLLDLHPARGLYAALSGSASLSDVIVPTSIPNLYFMDAEPNIPSPPDILSTNRFASLVEKLRESFDFVIFDTPPVSLFVDSAILSSVVDGTIFVARQNQTKRALAAKCVQQLRVADARILGTVMTFCTDDESSYYYAYYTQDGKRANRNETEAPSMPNDLNAESGASWEDAKREPRRATAQPASATPRANGFGAVNAAGPVSGGVVNPYAPNAYKATTSATAQKARHKNRRP